MLLIVVFRDLYNLWILKKNINKIFKQGIGIAEKSLETRRDHWGGNVNPNPYFDLVIHKVIHIGDSVICKVIRKHCNGVKIGIWGLHYHPQRSLLVSRLFSAIPIPCLKFLFLIILVHTYTHFS